MRLSGCFVIHKLGLATVDLRGRFEFSTSAGCEDM